MVTKLSESPGVVSYIVNLDIVSVSESGSWTVRLPPILREHQDELEFLLWKVFNGRLRSPENIALAQQLSLNWCASKCRQTGVSFEALLD